MKNTTYVEVVISTDINPTDRVLVGNFLTKGFDQLDNPQDTENVRFTGYVTHDGFSALCVLEDIGILTVAQLGD